MLQGKSRWYPPYVPFERKSVFCMSKAQAHEVYGLSNVGVDVQTLGEANFFDADWLTCFDEVPRRGSKVKCRTLKPDLWPRFYTLFTSVYQEPPTNYGMEVTKAFARVGFTQLKSVLLRFDHNIYVCLGLVYFYLFKSIFQFIFSHSFHCILFLKN